MANYDYLVVGAGLSGITIAERLASQSKQTVLLIDRRNHIGGNCYDYFDDSGILIHKYGPHIFHTDSKKVFDYLSQFTDWLDYKHKVLAFYKDKYYPIPINLETVNLFYDLDLKDEADLKKFLDTKKIKINQINNSKDLTISQIGPELYEAFIKNYTKKTWGKFPEELDKSVLARIPVKYNNDPYYFLDKFQQMPKFGYSKMFEKMIKHKNIKVLLDTDFFAIKNKINYKKLIYTGPIDKFFAYKHGQLEYKTTKFVFENFDKESYQENSVINYPGQDVRFTRIAEFKKLTGQDSQQTVICKEYPGQSGEITYPMMDKKNQQIFKKYLEEANLLKDVNFLGRLGLYKYYNMDQAIKHALDFFDNIKKQDV